MKLIKILITCILPGLISNKKTNNQPLFAQDQAHNTLMGHFHNNGDLTHEARLKEDSDRVNL